HYYSAGKDQLAVRCSVPQFKLLDPLRTWDPVFASSTANGTLHTDYTPQLVSYFIHMLRTRSSSSDPRPIRARTSNDPWSSKQNRLPWLLSVPFSVRTMRRKAPGPTSRSRRCLTASRSCWVEK